MLTNTDMTTQEPEAQAAELELESDSYRAAQENDRKVSSTGSRIAKAAVVLMAGTILSRVVGVGRESTISHLFGVGSDVDAYTIANQVVTIIYDLLISGSISAALVPVLSEYAQRDEDRAEFGKILSIVMTTSLVFLVAAVGVLEIFAKPLADFMSDQSGAAAVVPHSLMVALHVLPGALSSALSHATAVIPHTDTSELALLMTQWVLPGVIFMGLSGVVMAAHYALNRFVYPAFTSTVFNLAIILCAFALTGPFGLGVKSLAIGLVVGSIGMLALQLPGLRDIQLRPSLDINHPAMRKILKLYAPVAASVVLSSAALVVDRHLASATGEGNISAMRYATTLVQFGLGLVSAAISLASLPSLSSHFINGDSEAYKRTLASGLRLITALVLPAAAAIFALAVPLVGFIFQGGAFTVTDRDFTAHVLLFYVIGLPFSAVDQVLIFAFYARKNTLTPVLVGAAGVGVYLLIAFSSIYLLNWGVVGLVLANSIQLTFHALVTGALLFRALKSEGGLRGYGIGETILKAGGAALAMAAMCWLSWQFIAQYVPSSNILARGILLGVPGALGLALYIALAWFLRLPELEMVASRVRSRLKR